MRKYARIEIYHTMLFNQSFLHHGVLTSSLNYLQLTASVSKFCITGISGEHCPGNIIGSPGSNSGKKKHAGSDWSTGS